MKIGGTSTKFLVLNDTDRGFIPIVINFPVFTQDQLAIKKLVILPDPRLAIEGDVDTTNEKYD